MVSTLRCGRSNPGSNPGYGRSIFFSKLFFIIVVTHCNNKLLYYIYFLNNCFCFSSKSPGTNCSQEKYFANDSGKSSGDEELFGTSNENSRNLVNPVPENRIYFNMDQVHDLKKAKNLNEHFFMEMLLSSHWWVEAQIWITATYQSER